MEKQFVITVRGDDQQGLIAQLAGALFDLGANLADSSFHSLGGRFDYRGVADFPAGVSEEDVSDALGALDRLATAVITVHPAEQPGVAGLEGPISHVISVEGADRPGLVARLSEVLTDYGVNIIRMHSEQRRERSGMAYATLFHVIVPAAQVTALDNALSNLAGTMRLTLLFEPYSASPDGADSKS